MIRVSLRWVKACFASISGARKLIVSVIKKNFSRFIWSYLVSSSTSAVNNLCLLRPSSLLIVYINRHRRSSTLTIIVDHQHQLSPTITNINHLRCTSTSSSSTVFVYRPRRPFTSTVVFVCQHHRQLSSPAIDITCCGCPLLQLSFVLVEQQR